MLYHSIGLPLSISHWNLFPNFNQSPSCMLCKPFGGISYKKGVVFCLSCYLPEIISSSMLTVEIICLPKIGMLRINMASWHDARN
jgi:hypothetical protein